MMISVEGTGKISCNQLTREWRMLQCLYIANKSVTKIDRCAGALSSRRNQLLVLHISRSFLFTASLRRRRMSLYISVNCTSEFREPFETATHILPITTYFRTPHDRQCCSHVTDSYSCHIIAFCRKLKAFGWVGFQLQQVHTRFCI